MSITIREAPPGAGAPTVRENSERGAPTNIGPSSILTQLPSELAEAYVLVNQRSHISSEATLFEVTEGSSGTSRILKVYHSHVDLKSEALQRVRELEYPGVARLVNFGQLSDGRWWEVQELIEGGTLPEYRDRLGGHLEGETLQSAVKELAEALSVIHGAGIAHHDIKPDNFMVRSERPMRLALIDFGLSVVADSRTYYLTNRNATIIYQAPETMTKRGGEARDWWSLGLTIAYLATGSHPYEGMNEHAVLKGAYIPCRSVLLGVLLCQRNTSRAFLPK